MAIINRIGDFQDEMTAWRRDLHAHPELGFEETRTSALVAERLRAFGFEEVHTGLARTGVVGVLKAGSGDRAIGLRADMDALPIEEATGLSYASTNRGRMHACGHDGHTAMLLGAAKYLAETRNFDGTVYFIFQPAEEMLAGGRVMVEEGLFERFPIERVFGMHNWPRLPAGHFAMRPGPVMAAADRINIRLDGRGGHGAMPHHGLRSGGSRRGGRQRAADDRRAQCRPDRPRGRVDHPVPCRRCRQCDPADRDAAAGRRAPSRRRCAT